MTKAAIFIDTWKKEIFDRHLTDAGFAYEEFPGIADDCLLLSVDTADLRGLAVVAQAANDEADTVRNSRRKDVH